MPPRSAPPKLPPPAEGSSWMPYAAAAVAIAGLVAGWFWYAGSRSPQASKASTSTPAGDPQSSEQRGPSQQAAPGTPRALSPEQQRQQQEVMREMFRRAQASASQGEPVPSVDAAGVVLNPNEKPLDPIPAPGVLADGGTPFNDYVKQRIDTDLMPLAKDCYTTARVDNPSLSGKVVLYFRIVPNGSRGSRVEGARVVEDASTINDPEFSRCLAESMASVRFGPPPAGHGESSIQYPLTFAPGMLD